MLINSYFRKEANLFKKSGEILKIIVFGKKIFKKKNTDSRVYIYIYKFGWVHLDELVVIKKKNEIDIKC